MRLPSDRKAVTSGQSGSVCGYGSQLEWTIIHDEYILATIRLMAAADLAKELGCQP